MRAKLIAAAVAVLISAGGAYAFFRTTEAPEVRFATLTGESFSTSDLRGKVVLVNFWATWCVDCLKEMPKMVETYRKYSPRGYEMVAVAVQSDHPNQVAEFAQRRALPFKVALDTTGALARSFGEVRVTPMSYLIGKDGRVIRTYVGEPDWAEFHAEIEKALGS